LLIVMVDKWVKQGRTLDECKEIGRIFAHEGDFWALPVVFPLLFTAKTRKYQYVAWNERCSRMLEAHLRAWRTLCIQLGLRYPVLGVRKRLFEGLHRQGMVKICCKRNRGESKRQLRCMKRFIEVQGWRVVKIEKERRDIDYLQKKSLSRELGLHPWAEGQERHCFDIVLLDGQKGHSFEAIEQD
jgi:hypothetical protein